MHDIGSYLKKGFSPDSGVFASSQVLDIFEYACGFILGLALISNENPNFEMASSTPFFSGRWDNIKFSIAFRMELHP
jgi:hypothetical protein